MAAEIVDPPFWLPSGVLGPIRASMVDAGYKGIQFTPDGDVLIVTATGRTEKTHVVRCNALRDLADALEKIDKMERRHAVKLARGGL